MVNFLEQLVAEWYEFRGYFVRRNVRVGPLLKGGHESELDVVAFHPEKKHLVHIEPSMDAYSWAQREKRYAKKFGAGRKYIPGLFVGLELPEIEQIALFVFGSSKGRAKLGGGNVLVIADFMAQIKAEIKDRPIYNAAIPEQYPLLRALQFAAAYWNEEPR